MGTEMHDIEVVGRGVFESSTSPSSGGIRIKYGRTPLLKVLCICSFNFPYGMICGVMALYLLPREALRLWPEIESIMLGAMLVIVGISQLVCPVAGRMSDQCTSRWGRRRPFIFWGTVCCILSMLLAKYASLQYMKYTYLICLLFGMTSVNVVAATQAGLLPDMLQEDEKGIASGLTGALCLFGSLSGFLYVALWGGSFHPMYNVLCILLALAGVLTCFAADEEHYAGLDFFWVFVGRTFYYVAVSCQAFMLYYLRDVLGSTDPDEGRVQVATIAIISQLIGGIVALPMGYLSNSARIGRKSPIYIACFLMSTVYLGFLLLPPLLPPSQALEGVYVCAAVYGIGNGCFLSVDMALAMDTLPNKDNSAKDLGIWGVSAFLGSALGPFLWGFVLQAFAYSSSTPGEEETHYAFPGYVLMLLGGCLFCIFSGFCVKFVILKSEEEEVMAE